MHFAERPRFQTSARVARTPSAVVDTVLAAYAAPNVTNLAVGVAHWTTPTADATRRALADYGECDGERELLDALRAKLSRENGIDMRRREVLVTPGSNLAFVQALLVLCDAGDEVALFRPYYFSHLAALRLCGLEPLLLDCDASGEPSAEALRGALRRRGHRVRACVVTSPSNPSGAVCSAGTARELARICANSGLWLLSDEAYEHFVHDGAQHASLAAGAGREHVIPLFTFSKSYGLAGARVGYVAYPKELREAMIKVQDTLPTHAARASQHDASVALQRLGPEWVRERVRGLSHARSSLWEALQPLRGSADEAAPRGAFYFLPRLPREVVEMEAVRVLARDYRLLALPGSAFGAPGTLRISYGGLGDRAEVEEVAERLHAGAKKLASS